MKFYFLLLNILSTVLFFNASAQNVFIDDFNYRPVDSLENNGNWMRSGINTNNNIKVVEPGLEYMGYNGSGIGNSALIYNAGNGDIVFKDFSSPITTGAAYLAFMLRVDSLPTTFTQGYFISFNPNTGGTNLNTACHIKRLSETKFDLGIRKLSNIAYGNSDFEIHKTYLVVLKYSILPGSSNDSSIIYVFKSGVPASEPDKFLASTIEGDDYTGQGSVYLNNNYAQNGLLGCKIKVDGIRVGTSWETSILAGLSAVSDAGVNQKIVLENYPNPFSNHTYIQYGIPSKGVVHLQIQNALGKTCTSLVNEMMEEGIHEVEWDAYAYPSGYYFCTMTFNGIQYFKKLMIVP